MPVCDVEFGVDASDEALARSTVEASLAEADEVDDSVVAAATFPV